MPLRLSITTPVYLRATSVSVFYGLVLYRRCCAVSLFPFVSSLVVWFLFLFFNRPFSPVYLARALCYWPFLEWLGFLIIRFKCPDYSSLNCENFALQRLKVLSTYNNKMFWRLSEVPLYNITGPEDIFCFFQCPSRKSYMSQYFAGQLILSKRNGCWS